jgi:hypothetical protein
VKLASTATAAHSTLHYLFPSAVTKLPATTNIRTQTQARTDTAPCAPVFKLLHQACQLARLPAQLANESKTGNKHSLQQLPYLLSTSTTHDAHTCLELLHQACQLRRLPSQPADQPMTGSNH